jgi:hypothetical protein
MKGHDLDMQSHRSRYLSSLVPAGMYWRFGQRKIEHALVVLASDISSMSVSEFLLELDNKR